MKSFAKLLGVAVTVLVATGVVGTAQAANVSERIAASAFNNDGPQGAAVVIKNVDLIEFEASNGSYHAHTQRLDVYVWIRGSSERERADLLVANHNDPHTYDPAAGYRPSEPGVFVGQDAANPAYGVYRVRLALPAESQAFGASFCAQLYAILPGGSAQFLMSMPGLPMPYFQFCH